MLQIPSSARNNGVKLTAVMDGEIVSQTVSGGSADGGSADGGAASDSSAGGGAAGGGAAGADSRASACRGGLISRAIVRENIRRFWPIGLVSLLVYAAVWVLPLAMAKASAVADDAANVESASSYASDMLVGTTFGILGVVLCMAFVIISAVAVFKYLHLSASFVVTSTFPVKKSSLFFSNFLSGLMIAIVPFVASGIALLAIIGDYWKIDWGRHALEACVIILFTYAASVLAGMVSGNTVTHIITAIMFNFAWMAVYFVIANQIDTGLFGLNVADNMNQNIAYLHPLGYFTYHMGESATPTHTLWLVAYFVIAAFVTSLAYLLHRSFKGERSGDSITRRPIEYVFIYIIAFGGMFVGEQLLGIFDMARYERVIDPMTYVSPYSIVGAVIGAVVAFIVATMIVRKGTRVFNVQALRRFAIFAVAMAVFLVCTLTNITGVETRVPNAADVKTAAASFDSIGLFAPYKSGMGYWSDLYIPINDEDGIKALAGLHQNALGDKAYITDEYMGVVVVSDVDDDVDADENQVSNLYLSLAYGLKSGKTESRAYSLSGKYMVGSEDYARLVSSESVKNYLTIKNLLGYEKLDMPTIYTEYFEDRDPDTDVRDKLTAAALSELAACLDADYLAMSADDMKNAGPELFTLRMSSKKPTGKFYGGYGSALAGDGKDFGQYLKDNDFIGGHWDMPVYYTVTEKSVKTIAFLKELGVYDSIVKSAEELRRQGKEEAEKYD